MEFSDDGVILSARPHGETHAVVEILTRQHGRWAGLVYGGQGRKNQPLLQPGNGVVAQWKGRGADSLGHFTLELQSPRAGALLQDRLALCALSALTTIAAETLPERENHPGVYAAMTVVLDNLDDPALWPALFARWELGLLTALGFGLELDRCAATGSMQDLVYISPKTGRAISRGAGEPYKDRLLPLPGFLRGSIPAATRAEALDALSATGFFLETRIFHLASRTLPDARLRIVEMLSPVAPEDTPTEAPPHDG